MVQLSSVSPSSIVDLPVWASDSSFLLLSLSHVQFLHFRLEEEEEEEEEELETDRVLNRGSRFFRMYSGPKTIKN